MKNVSIFRVKEKKSDKAPDYEMIASVQKGDGSYDRHYIGKCWSRTSQSGVKYLSCSLNDTRVYNEKTYIGYSIHADTAKNDPEDKSGTFVKLDANGSYESAQRASAGVTVDSTIAPDDIPF